MKPTKQNPKVKWVKKASQWVSTWFDDKGTQHQEWSVQPPISADTKEEV